MSMEYTTLGGTGVTVSRVCLGCTSFSESGDGWHLDREESDVEYLEEPYVPVRVSGWDGARERMNYGSD